MAEAEAEVEAEDSRPAGALEVFLGEGPPARLRREREGPPTQGQARGQGPDQPTSAASALPWPVALHLGLRAGRGLCAKLHRAPGVWLWAWQPRRPHQVSGAASFRRPGSRFSLSWALAPPTGPALPCFLPIPFRVSSSSGPPLTPRPCWVPPAQAPSEPLRPRRDHPSSSPLRRAPAPPVDEALWEGRGLSHPLWALLQPRPVLNRGRPALCVSTPPLPSRLQPWRPCSPCCWWPWWACLWVRGMDRRTFGGRQAARGGGGGQRGQKPQRPPLLPARLPWGRWWAGEGPPPAL